jgi:hypothetical protein
MTRKHLGWLLVMAVLVGCESGSDSAEKTKTRRGVNFGGLGIAPPGEDLSRPEKKTQQPTTTPKQPVGTPAQNTAQPNRQIADVGEGAKGRNYGGGIMTYPLAEYWVMKGKIRQIELQGNMRNIEAIDPTRIKTTEDYLREVKKLGLTLPELGPGEKFIYDPQRKELMVEYTPLQGP